MRDRPEYGAVEAACETAIVLAIDDPAQHGLTTRLLAREGCAAPSAAEGRTGLEMARALWPKAILLDVMMPDMDGWLVPTALKAGPELSGIPVIVVTVVRARGLATGFGAADHVLEPVEWARGR